jgi:hypothetical protein
MNADIITANNFGDLAIITKGKYTIVKELAHSKLINCLLIKKSF